MNIDERGAVAAQFGVSVEQVERDHLISHVLGFLSDPTEALLCSVACIESLRCTRCTVRMIERMTR